MAKIKNVLFLCSGNSCRSVFAEYYAKWLKNTTYKDSLREINFDSAGIRHYFETPREGTVNYLNSKGISLEGFVAKDITEELINKQDLILGFEARYHVRKLKRKFKHIENLNRKVYMLLEYAGQKDARATFSRIIGSAPYLPWKCCQLTVGACPLNVSSSPAPY